MTEQELKDIIDLIRSSKLLSDVERADWESSLPAMNDNQIHELSKILGSVPPKPEPVKAPEAAIPSQPVASPSPTAVPATTIPAGMPSQSRQDDFLQKSGGYNSPKGLGAIASMQNTPTTNTPKFLDQLTNSGQSKNASQYIDPLERTTPERVTPLPPKPPTPNISRLPGNLTQSASGVSMQQPVQTPPVSYTEAPALGKQNVFHTANTPVKPANDYAVKSDIDLGRLETLQQVSSMTPNWFRSNTNEDVVKALKQLILKKDYMPVILAIQASPLYQTYVSVGKAVLTSGEKFEDLAEKIRTEGGEFLDQEEFERFADVLSSLQVN